MEPFSCRLPAQFSAKESQVRATTASPTLWFESLPAEERPDCPLTDKSSGAEVSQLTAICVYLRTSRFASRSLTLWTRDDLVLDMTLVSARASFVQWYWRRRLSVGGRLFQPTFHLDSTDLVRRIWRGVPDGRGPGALLNCCRNRRVRRKVQLGRPIG